MNIIVWYRYLNVRQMYNTTVDIPGRLGSGDANRTNIKRIRPNLMLSIPFFPSPQLKEGWYRCTAGEVGWAWTLAWVVFPYPPL